MSAFLVPLDPGLCLIPLEKAIVLIGRQADCDVSLTHSRKVSRKHCCVAQVNDAYVVRDLGSTNGVFVNGSRVRKEAGLALGDELAIGDVRFRLQAGVPSNSVAKNNGGDIKQTYEDPALAQPAARPMMSAPPGMNVPVALPEMGQDFAVEASIPHMRSLKRKSPDADANLSVEPYERDDDVIPLASDSF
jgi:predicted component of type VI protein secretion system